MADTARSKQSISAGDVLAGKYRIEQRLGQGGMAVVVSATHLRLGERVAIKVLDPRVAANPDAVRRFEREARTAVRIKSEHVARVIDISALEDGTPYIVMEHLDGADLGQVLKTRGPLPVAEAVGHVLQACEALAEAHAAGIVHRDLKPGNLFLIHRADGSPCVKVLDFGISKLAPTGLLDKGEPTLTTTDSFLGSPIYMAPEQMEDPKGVDARADVWSLGATLYRLLTRKAPFEADTMPVLCSIILNGTRPASLLALRPDVPPALDAVILRCMSRDRRDRFANVGDLATALADFGPPGGQLSAARAHRVLLSAGIAASQPVPAPPADVPTPLEAISPPDTLSTPSPAVDGARAPGSRMRGAIAGTGGALLLGAGIALGLALQSPARRPPSDVAPAHPGPSIASPITPSAPSERPAAPSNGSAVPSDGPDGSAEKGPTTKAATAPPLPSGDPAEVKRAPAKVAPAHPPSGKKKEDLFEDR